MKKLLGNTDIEDALRKLDKLTQEEVRMATAQLLTLTHGVDDKVTRIDDEVKGVDSKVEDIGDTVRVVLHDGARCVIFSYDSFVNVFTTRWKRNKMNRTANSKRNDGNYAAHGERGRGGKVFVVP